MPGSPTPNIGLTQGTIGGDTALWGGNPGINGNNTVLDLVVGGIATIGLNNSNVILNAAQFQAGTIVFNSTLTGSVTITFPSSFIKGYTIQNLCTGSSAFIIQMNVSGFLNQICAPPGEAVDIFNNGSALQYRNLDHVGTFREYAGSALPNWVANCSVLPYLNCDGTTFSSATYPVLTTILGSTTLPDSRGRVRYTLDQGQNHNGGANLATIGSSTVTLSQGNLPSATLTGGSLGLALTNVALGTGQQGGGFTPSGLSQTQVAWSSTGAVNITSSAISVPLGGSGNAFNILTPGFVGGITMIRAG